MSKLYRTYRACKNKVKKKIKGQQNCRNGKGKTSSMHTAMSNEVIAVNIAILHASLLGTISNRPSKNYI